MIDATLTPSRPVARPAGSIQVPEVLDALLNHGLMTEKLARRGLHVPLNYEPDYLQATPVRLAMTTNVAVLRVDDTVDVARQEIDGTSHSAYPLVDEDRHCVGIVSRTDLLAPDATANAALSRIASPDVVTVAPDDMLLTALERIIDEEVEHLPVLDDQQHVVGMCTRTDILRARSRHIAAEQSQEGWQVGWRRKRSPSAE